MKLQINSRFYAFYKHQIKKMKLVLKYNTVVKLYTEEIKFNSIMKFITQEFNLKRNTIAVSFLDDQNDQITILSDEDINVMKDVLSQNQYVKININGQEKKKSLEKSKESVEVKETISEDTKVEEPLKTEEKPKKEKYDWRRHCKNRDSKQGQSSHDKKKLWKGKFKQMENFAKKKIAKFVDERVQALIPFFKEQMKQNSEKNVVDSEIIHNGFSCKICLMSPIQGVRYECLVCPDFSICQVCEQNIQHEHNLLKVKKIVQKLQGSQQKPFKFFKNLFKRHCKGNSSSSEGESLDKEERRSKRRGQHRFNKACDRLSVMFGGKPQDYKVFVEKSPELRPFEVVQKYAHENGRVNELKEKRISNRSNKLSKIFGKPAEDYQQIVTQNPTLNIRQLMNKLYENGAEQRKERGCRWEEKKMKSKECKAEKSQKKQKTTSKPKKAHIKKEMKKQVQQSRIEQFKGYLYNQDKDSKEKGDIFCAMLEIFGEEKKSEFFHFIEKNFSQGKDKIIQKWCETQ